MSQENVNLESLNVTLGEMLKRAQHPEPAFREIGVLMVQEMKTNIEQGGRPTKWPPSIRAREKGGMTLRDSGTLMNSITSEADSKQVAAGPTAVGKNHLTDPRIMALLAYGGQVTRYARSELFQRNRTQRGKNKGRFKRGTTPGRGHTLGEYVVNYPARDYTYIPPESQETFGEILGRFVIGPS